MTIEEFKVLEEGDRCPICGGEIGYKPVVDCSCHINPPCSKCVDNSLVCLDCGYDGE